MSSFDFIVEEMGLNEQNEGNRQILIQAVQPVFNSTFFKVVCLPLINNIVINVKDLGRDAARFSMKGQTASIKINKESTQDRSIYLLHEFFHYLQSVKGPLQKRYNDIIYKQGLVKKKNAFNQQINLFHNFEKQYHKLINKGLRGFIRLDKRKMKRFLVGLAEKTEHKKIPVSTVNNLEYTAYLANRSIDWSVIKNKRILAGILNLFKRYGRQIFRTNTLFYKTNYNNIIRSARKKSLKRTG